MQLKIQRSVLLEGLQKVIGVVEKRQTMPILGNVLLSWIGNTLSITATDTEIEMRVQVPVDLASELLQQATLPGRKLLDICRALPEDSLIDLQTDAERAWLRSGRSRFALSTLPVEGFPIFEEGQVIASFTLPQSQLYQLLQTTHFAIAQQDVRFYLNGLLLDVKNDQIVAIATDGHRFALSNLPLSESINPVQVIVPRKSVIELLHLLKAHDADVQISLGEHAIRVCNPHFTFTSKLIDARFPDYSRLLPKGTGTTIVIEREVLRQALSRVALLSSDKDHSVQVKLSDHVLHLLTRNPAAEEAEESLSIEYSGETIEANFNVNYCLDVLNIAVADQMQLTFLQPSNRVCFEAVGNSNSLYLVMPLQI